MARERQADRGHPRVPDLQAPQLHHHQEQGQRPRAHRDQEVLQVGPRAHPPQGDPLSRPTGDRAARPPAGRVTFAPCAGPTPDARRGRSAWSRRPRSGDREAFDELVRHTYLETYTLAFRLTGDEEDARDVVQESYLRAYRGLQRFRGDAQFSTWLYRITANCASTQLGRRARHRHDELDDELPDDRAAGPRQPRGRRSTPRPCATGSTWPWPALPPRLRAVVVLRDVYDLPHEAIAAELGISVSAAKVRLHRARRRLREDLFPCRSDEPSRADQEDARAV